MTTISKTSIDVRNIKETDCTPSEFPLQKLKLENRPDGFQMIVNRSTLNAMKEHGQTSMNAEVGGMLVGELCWDGEAFLVVEASVIGEHTDGNVASVTFTAETWEHVWSVMEKDYPDKSIVGWYHTHPGFGIFLSHMDLFICEHTFNAPHHVAYVYDPQSEDDGWFIWNNSKPTKIKPLVIEDAPALQSNRHIRLSTNNSVMQAAADKIVISSEETQDNWTVILIIFSTILLILCTSGIGYLTFENINS
ncbi:MAG: Mov34/MPN/PAD-1 family protein, partial [Planctomycetaceae bacterium]|nr:Mov34/MPN/PAD-1 family protein [Planctomycetaceae bacterium]